MKRIIVLCLAIIVFLSVFVGCDQQNIRSDENSSECCQDSENTHEEKTDDITESTEVDSNEEANASEFTSSSDLNASESEYLSEFGQENETTSDVQLGGGELKLVQYTALTKYSIWLNEKGEYYLYLNAWDTYRCLPGLSAYHSTYFNDNCIAVDSETATISVIHQYGKNNEPIIITYHIYRSNSFVESYPVPLNIKASSEHDTFFVNMHDSAHGYYFLTPNISGAMDERIEGVQDWPLFMFETTDGGKNWKQISTNTFYSTKNIEVLKFVSSRVGIVSFRNEGWGDVWDWTYLTVDGGLTWNQLPQLPYPASPNELHVWYSDVIDIECIDDYYYLTIKSYYLNSSDNNCSVEIRFQSKDLISWKLIQ